MAQQLYFTTPVSGVQRLYQGAELTGYVTLGNLVVQPYYNLTGAQAASNSYIFDNPWSITIPGQQLPNVPLQKAGIVLDYKAPDSIFEWLADAQHVGTNNPNNLPPYTTYDAGVTAQLTRGTLTFAATNITDTYAGIFASPANAVPFTTAGGYAIANIARPLMPRTYSVTYSARFGQGALSSQTATAFHARGAGGGPTAAVISRPSTGRPRRPHWSGRPRRPRFSIALLAVAANAAGRPVCAPSNPTTCSADNAAKARQLSAEFESVCCADRSGTDGGRLSRDDAGTGVDRCYRNLSRTRRDLCAGDHAERRRHAARAWLAACRCTSRAATMLRSANSTHRRARSSSCRSSPSCRPSAFTSSRVSRNRVKRRSASTSFRRRRPRIRSQVRTSTSCTGAVRNLATQSLSELKNHFAIGAPTPSWTITAHAAKSGTWYELDPGDATVIPAVIACGRIAATTPTSSAKQGFDGKTIPELNYAPSLGIYLVRPTPRPRPSP